MLSLNLSDATLIIRTNLFGIYGPTNYISADLEFRNNSITSLCAENDVKFEPRRVLRYIKIGSVESNNSSIRLLFRRLLKYEKYYRQRRGLYK